MSILFLYLSKMSGHWELNPAYLPTGRDSPPDCRTTPLSEHPESNRDYLLPKQTYYHYTMLRQYCCRHTGVLPVYDARYLSLFVFPGNLPLLFGRWKMINTLHLAS